MTNILKKLSFKIKLILLCCFISSVAATIGIISYRGLNSVEENYDRITDLVMPKLEEANEMFVEYRRIRITLRTLGLPGITEAQANEAIQDALKAISNFEESNKVYVSYGFIPGQKELYDNLNSSWLTFKAVGEKVIALHKTGKPEDREAMIKIFFNECPQAAKVFTVDMEKLLTFHKEKAKMNTADAKASADKTNMLIFTVGLIGVLLGLFAGTVFASKVSQTIGRVTETLAESAEQVSSSSGQIASASEQLSQASAEQAASLEETAASLEEISSMVSKSADNAKAAAVSSTEAQEKAEEGRTAVSQVMTSMDEISQSNEVIVNQINESNNQMAEIVRVIQEIGNKTKVINDIVFQTKLLSFNASVEAARAGEQGKGFAVVAEEVGKLAQMSGNAAKEISDMLDHSITKVESIVSETKSKVEIIIDQGKQKVESGVSVARQCTSVLNEIVVNISKVSSLVQEISQASREQAEGVGEINKAMAQLDVVTQQNTAASEETANAAESLSSQAESLKAVVEDLVVTIQGSSSSQELQPVKGPKVLTASNKKASNVIPMKSKPSVKRNTVNSNAGLNDNKIPSHDNVGFKNI